MTNYSPPAAVERRPESGFAVTSLVLGCVGIVSFWLYGIVPILAIIFGGISMNKSKGQGVKPSGMAVAGLVLGIVELALMGLFILLVVAGS